MPSRPLESTLFSLGILIALSICCGSAYAEMSQPDLIARGKYLSDAADCMPCHTSSKHKPYAGGLKIDTPFGAIYSPNITPDPATGIGIWTFKAFKNAVHAGIRADGQYLYPAMPFDSFTKIDEPDLVALWAYVRTLPPVKQKNKDNELRLPFNIRYGMLVWRSLFFDEGYFQPNPRKGLQWNRGAYFVQALGHCGDCHTPRNFMGATISSRALTGAQVDHWYAPNITAQALKTVNGWSKAQLIPFLRKGAATNSTDLGPMREIVHDSLSRLTEGDLNAVAIYLLNSGESEESSPSVMPELSPASERTGAKLYTANCANCHEKNGQGAAGSIPPLAHNPAVLAAKPFDILSAVLGGLPARDHFMAMPSFAGVLTDQSVAKITNYVRTNWGNDAPPNATPDLVAAWRSALTLPVYASDAARSFVCPTVGPGSDSNLDSRLIAALSAEMRLHPVAYAKFVDMYRAQRPHASTAEIVDGMIAAYCPIVAASSMSDRAKSAALKRFGLNATAYVASQKVSATEPEMAIIWATPVGYTLAEHVGESKPTLSCPPDDGSLLPKSLVAEAQTIVGKPSLEFTVETAAGQADSLANKQPAAKLANVANALILTYCKGIKDISGADPADKQSALKRYGEQVISALQTLAEAAAQSKPAPEGK